MGNSWPNGTDKNGKFFGLDDENKRTYLAPREERQIKLSYWSNNFNGKLNIFKKELQNEKINIFLSYRLNEEKYFFDSLSLIPDPAIIKKWK